MTHKIRFIRDPSSGMSCAICNCGFSVRVSHDDYDQIIKMVENHEAPKATFPAKKLGFVSGLPDR